jgi:uncharacterized 2Fe-2S/4Fe-4S cluster protein (DUF4445 family)
VFTPSGLAGRVESGTTVLDAARRLGADLDTVCGGRGICGRCQVVPGVGSFAKWAIDVTADALSAPAQLELDYHGNRPLLAGQRLGCAARICGDVVIDVPAMSQVHRQVVRKDLDLAPIVVDPTFSLFYVEVAPAELGDAVSASGMLRNAVAEQHGRPVPDVDGRVLADVHPALAGADGAATVALRHHDIVAKGHRDGVANQISDGRADVIVAVWPGYVGAVHGVAVDIGSTTIAGHLCDLSTGEVLASAGRMNPQIRFGEDLMSRVSYVMMNPGGERELTAAVRTALDELIGELVADAEVDREHVLEVVLVGNPIMHHIALGIDPTPLGSAPFVLATDEAVIGQALDLDLDLPAAAFYAGPCIAGHVGADTAAALLAEGPHRGDAMQLLVDVGTNAEIVLGDRTRQYAASSPTGPAFEGAQISCGQRATAGAIERVRIDRDSLAPSFKVIGSDVWSDDPGFEDSVASSGVTGVCGSGIIDAVAEMYLAGLIETDGTISGEMATRTERIVSDGRTFSYVLYADGDTHLSITQNDVRAIQLAKAALRAGIDLLVEHAGSPVVADIRLAGAFGAHIDPVHAMVLGLIPDCPVEGVRSVGNAAGAGAVQALLSRSLRAEMESAVRRVIKIETATEPRFQELFVAAMALPHATSPSPNLATVVDLPAREPTAPRGGRRRRPKAVPSVMEDVS